MKHDPQKQRSPSEDNPRIPAFDALLALRGHFRFTPPSPEPDRSSSFIDDTFPVDPIQRTFVITAEHCILVFDGYAQLLTIREQQILWTLSWPASLRLLMVRHDFVVMVSASCLYLWNMCTDQLVQTFSSVSHLPPYEHDGKLVAPSSLPELICDFALSSDGSLMALGLTWSGSADVWSVTTGEHLYTLEPEEEHGTGCSVAFSPDGQILATGNCEEGNVSIWRAADGQWLRRLKGHGRVGDLVFCPDGTMLTYEDGSGHYDREVLHAWDTRTWEEITDFVPNAGGLRFSQGGTLLALLARPGGNNPFQIHLWDVLKRQRRTLFEDAHITGSPVGIFPEDALLIGKTRGTLHWWDLDSRQEVYRLETSGTIKAEAAFSPDGAFLVTSSRDGETRVWTTTPFVLVNTVSHGNGLSFGGIISPDQEYIASIDRNHGAMVRITERQGQRAVCLGYLTRSSSVRTLAFSRKSRFLAVGNAKGKIALWKKEPSSVQAPCSTFQGNESALCCLTFGPDDQVLASGSDDGLICLWKVTKADAPPVMLSGHRQAVTCLAFSSNGRWLASGSADQTVRLWDMRSGRCVRIMQEHQETVVGVAFSHNNRRVASCGRDQRVYVRTLCSLVGSALTTTPPVSIPQWEHVLSGRDPAQQPLQESVVLWRVPKGVPCYEIAQENTFPTGLIFQKDGTLLVSGHSCGPARIWHLAPGQR